MKCLSAREADVNLGQKNILETLKVGCAAGIQLLYTMHSDCSRLGTCSAREWWFFFCHFHFIFVGYLLLVKGDYVHSTKAAAVAVRTPTLVRCTMQPSGLLHTK